MCKLRHYHSRQLRSTQTEPTRMEDWNLRKSLKVEIFTAYFWLQASQSYVEFWLQLNTFFTWNMLTREELQHLCLHQIIFTNVVITIQSYWKHQTRFLWMNERRGLFCSLQWIYTFLSKTVKAQLDYKPYINDSFCVEEVRELCLVITKDHFFFACILAWHLWDVESILQVNFSFGIIFLC